MTDRDVKTADHIEHLSVHLLIITISQQQVTSSLYTRYTSPRPLLYAGIKLV